MTETAKNHDNTKDSLLEAVLSHVPFDGWKDETLEKAATEMGKTAQYGYVFFPGGIAEVADYFAQKTDAEMLEILEAKNLKSMKIRERISTAILTRLELYGKHKEAVRRLVSYYALPQHAAKGTQNVFCTCDAMWRAAGDTSTDFNYYTKRLTLTGVYTSTVLYWLKDDSEDEADTKAFLARRIEDVMKIEKVKGKVKEGFGQISRLFPFASH